MIFCACAGFVNMQILSVLKFKQLLFGKGKITFTWDDTVVDQTQL